LNKTIEDLLNEVDYSQLAIYLPTPFALKFVNFVKIVSSTTPEENLTPIIHLMMLDKVPTMDRRVINLCFRGSGKTTIFSEYLVLYIGVFGLIEGFGDVPAAIFVGNAMDKGVAQLRKNIELKWANSPFLQKWIPEPEFRDDHITLVNKDGHRFNLQMYGAQSSVRGSRDGNNRPVLALLDDLIKDDKDAASPTIMADINNLITKEIPYALNPARHKIIWNGTPFNKQDPLIAAVESGRWQVNVWPVCEQWPCTREDWRGAWPDRFTYDYCLDMAANDIVAFQQEMMLQISSDEAKLVKKADISWEHVDIHPSPRYTYYITTDFATKATIKNDFSVIFVWAYDNEGRWHWVNGVVARQGMGKNMDDLFRLVLKYRPIGVTVEVSGQQGGFIPWITENMVKHQVWFNVIETRPMVHKLVYFSSVTPLITKGQVWFPTEFKDSIELKELMHEMDMATPQGLKARHDDCIDAVSRLMNIIPVKPGISSVTQVAPTPATIWDKPAQPGPSAISSYVV
jgi:predicted phage terminase large subunit-like protein